MKLADSDSANRVQKEIEASAAEWIVKQATGINAEEAGQLERWLAGDPRHAVAFAEQERTWVTLNCPRRSGQASLLARTLDGFEARQRRRRNRLGLAAVGLAAAAAVTFVFAPRGWRKEPEPTVVTVAVRPDRQVLPDGSMVELNAGAEIAVSFTAGQRRVRLERGEALFHVAKNPAVPFVVSAGPVDITAVGTAFSVRHGSEIVGVLVTEGRVTVARPLENRATIAPSPLLLGAGDRVLIPAEPGARSMVAPEKVDPVRIEEALAWRGKRVEFSDTPVAEAVELLNRQNRVQLVLGDAKVARIQLSGIFWADDPDGFVRLLENGMNVRSERSGNVITLRQR